MVHSQDFTYTVSSFGSRFWTVRAFELASGTPPRRAGPPAPMPRPEPELKPFSSEGAEVNPMVPAVPINLTSVEGLITAPPMLACAAPIISEGPAWGAFWLMVLLALGCVAWLMFALLLLGLNSDGF